MIADKLNTVGFESNRLPEIFFAFIVFNATIVFGPDLYRILAVPVGILLILIFLRRHS